MAVAGFVLSLIGLLIFPVVFGVLGLIFSILGMKQRRKKGLAIAGLVISIIDCAWFLLALL